MGRQKSGKHYTRPAIKVLMGLCRDNDFKKKVDALRLKWHITKLAASVDDAGEFWRNLCKTESTLPDYYDRYDEGSTQSQQFQRDLEELCKDPVFCLPSDPSMWVVIYQILLRFDLDNVMEEDVLTLPLAPALSRIPVVYKDNRLYLDVTFAGSKDVKEVWGQVIKWQREVRPFLILRHGIPVDLLRDIKPGRTKGTNKELALEVARLWDDLGWRDKDFNREYEWLLSEDSYGNLTRCGRARYWRDKGRILRKTGEIPTEK